MTDLLRFFSKVDTSGDCWLWTGNFKYNGYGRFYSDAARNRKAREAAHKWLYRTVVGLQSGLVVDQLCSNRACVRLDRLDAVTQAENIRRTHERGRASFQNKVTCLRGHPYIPENRSRKPDGSTRCRLCHNEERVRYANRG